MLIFASNSTKHDAEALAIIPETVIVLRDFFLHSKFSHRLVFEKMQGGTRTMIRRVLTRHCRIRKP